jgi:hypothetical protein
VPGKYWVFDDNMNPFEIFCDFDPTTNATWTLVQSYQFKYKSIFNTAYSTDLPVSEDTPRWEAYIVFQNPECNPLKMILTNFV